MAITQQQSTQMQALEARPPVGIPTTDWKGVKRILRFEFTQGAAAGDVGSTAELVRLPVGNTRVFLHESWLHHSAFGAARTLDIGWRAYRSADAQTPNQVEDPNGLVAALDVSTEDFIRMSVTGTLGGDDTRLFTAGAAASLFATVSGGTIPAGATLTGYFTYVQD